MAAGKLGYPGEHDWFAINLAASQAYDITVTGLTLGEVFVGLAATVGDIDTGEVNAGVVSTSSAAAGTGTAATVQTWFTPDTAGTYYIDVSEFGASADYTVSAAAVANDYVDNASTTGTVTVGAAATTGELGQVGEHDWLAVTLAADQAYEFTTTGLSGDGQVQVGNAADLDEGTKGTSTTIESGATNTTLYTWFTPTTAGTYYVDVSDPATIGPYSVSAAAVANDFPDNTTTTGTVAVGGAATAGKLGQIGEHDWLRVTLTANQAYEFTVNGLSDAAQIEVGAAADLDTSDVALNGTYAPSAPSVSSQTWFTPATTGTYYVDISDVTVGSYSVSAVAVANDYADDTTTAGTIDVGGAATTGTLGQLGEHDWLAVTLTANQAYLFTAIGLTDVGQLVVGDATDLESPVAVNTPAGGGGVAATLQTWFTPGSSGTYYVDISDPVTIGGTGGYSVSAVAVANDFTDNATTTGVVTVDGAASTGNLSQVGEHDWFQITLAANQAYEFTATGLTALGSLKIGTAASLDESGSATNGLVIPGFTQAQLAAFYPKTTLHNWFTPTTSGVYDIDVSDPYGSGSYSVSAAAVPNDFTDNATTTGVVAIACFLAGTAIATDARAIPVQDLAIGTLVQTTSGVLVPVKWIGHRTIDCRRHRQPQAVWPIRIRAGAFGDDLPVRDLLLSPEHAVFADGVLVPIRCLVNGITIAQEPHDEVTYYHVELDRHDVIFAEGLPCESWLDTGNRAMFANCPVTDLHPSFARDAGHAWRHDACAPLVEAGAQVDTLRARLHALAGASAEDTSTHQAGELRGWIDSATTAAIAGWAWQPEHASHPARLEFLADDVWLGEMTVGERRDDVRDAGHGDGRCGFTFRPSPPLSSFKAHTIRVRRAADGAELGNSGRVIAAAEQLDAAALMGFAAALNATSAAAGAPERAALLRFMADETDRLRTICARPVAALPDTPRPLALFIDERLPTPDQDSASQVVLDHIRSLRDLGYQVAFAAGDPSAADAAPLDALGVTVCRPPAIASVEEMLRRLGGDAALVYLHRVTTASLYAGLVRHHCPQALLVYSVADLHFVRIARQAALEGRADLAAESRRLRDRELLAANAADRVITHSPAEAAILRKFAPQAKVHVVPWSVPARPVPTPFDQRRGVAFIGSYRHAPNLDAARWLVERIMPLVHQQDPTIECLLVGSHMPDSLRRLAHAGIVPLGHVADLAGVFDRVRLTVAPLRFGAGIKGKVLASLAAGVPCVCSPVAAEGMNLSGCTGADAAELAALILRMHGDARFNGHCAEAGLQLIATEHTAARVDQGMAHAIGGAALQDRRRA